MKNSKFTSSYDYDKELKTTKMASKIAKFFEIDKDGGITNITLQNSKKKDAEGFEKLLKEAERLVEEAREILKHCHIDSKAGENIFYSPYKVNLIRATREEMESVLNNTANKNSKIITKLLKIAVTGIKMRGLMGIETESLFTLIVEQSSTKDMKIPIVLFVEHNLVAKHLSVTIYNRRNLT
jgi:hypothetical protein